jgi:hypothetical protein
MAKIANNADRFPIQWDGNVTDGDKEGDEIPTDISIIWGNNPFTWNDVAFIQELADGIGTGSRRERQDRLNKLLDDEDKKKKIIHLICRVKGEKVFDDKIEVKDVQVNVEDVDMVTEQILGKIKVETKDVI